MDEMRKKLPVRNNLIPWFLFTMTFGLLLQIVFLNAPLQSDDTTYFPLRKTCLSNPCEPPPITLTCESGSWSRPG